MIPDGAELFTLVALPTLIALLATVLLMGRQGMRAFWRALVISVVLFWHLHCRRPVLASGNRPLP